MDIDILSSEVKTRKYTYFGTYFTHENYHRRLANRKLKPKIPNQISQTEGEEMSSLLSLFRSLSLPAKDPNQRIANQKFQTESNKMPS